MLISASISSVESGFDCWYIVRTSVGTQLFMAPATTKQSRIGIRTTKEQKALIMRAASAQGQRLSDFVLASAQEKAELVLADQKDFVLPAERWKDFVAALDRPARRHERLNRLMSEPSVLER